MKITVIVTILLAGFLFGQSSPNIYHYDIQDAFTAWNLRHDVAAQRALNHYIEDHCSVWAPIGGGNARLMCNEWTE